MIFSVLKINGDYMYRITSKLNSIEKIRNNSLEVLNMNNLI